MLGLMGKFGETVCLVCILLVKWVRFKVLGGQGFNFDSQVEIPVRCHWLRREQAISGQTRRWRWGNCN